MSARTYQLQEHVRLLELKNPWGLGAVEMTCFAWYHGLGMSKRVIAETLYGYGNQDVVKKISGYIDRVFETIVPNPQTKTTGYGSMVEQIQLLVCTPMEEEEKIARIKRRIGGALRNQGLIPQSKSRREDKTKTSKGRKPVVAAVAEIVSQHFGDPVFIDRGPTPPKNCKRCAGRIIQDREDRDIWNCFSCGWAFTVSDTSPVETLSEDLLTNRRLRRRGPRTVSL
ncbi:MAG: hypothetical protein Q8P13_02455 [bacterium]|nr:hypothetical protein [bacterium]